LAEEESEIVRNVGKRRRGKRYRYKVCWKRTWLRECEVGKAQELRGFEAKDQVQRRSKREKPTRAEVVCVQKWSVITRFLI